MPGKSLENFVDTAIDASYDSVAKVPVAAGPPFSPIFEKLFDGVGVVVPGPWRLAYANPALGEWLGSLPSDLIGRRLEDVFHGAGLTDLLDRIQRVYLGEVSETIDAAPLLIEHAGRVAAEVRLCRVDWNGQTVVGLVVRSTVPTLRGNSVRATGSGDPLTGLPDRSFLMSRLATLLHGDRLADRQFAVLFVDLDNFKQVNDSYGHLVGDRVLSEAARRLSECVRTGDHVVRYGGDEFVVLVERVTSSEEIEPVIERIHAALATPIAIPEGEAMLSVSVGVALASPTHQTPEDLIAEADRAMYAAKRPGG